jgi:hypothetical protein
VWSISAPGQAALQIQAHVEVEMVDARQITCFVVVIITD